jgi:transaldolase/glucose-6-phosphate isomerase
MTISSRELEGAVRARLVRFERERTLQRLWDGNPTVWVDDPGAPEIADRLGWLTVGSLMAAEIESLRRFAAEVANDCDRVVLLGMGGSSLAPEVLWRAFGRREGFPAFRMLDSTHPQAVRHVDEEGDPERTLFLVASKSGTTIETDSFFRFFWERAGRRGTHFVAITDPGSPLDRLAADRGFRRTFRNPPDIGGRFSALSFFGLVPAVLMGIDVATLLARAEEMAHQCSPEVSVADNPGATLGVTLAEAALAGRDKLTLLLAPHIAPFGLWAEQLVAESTGKGGQGILPVPCEPIDSRVAYRDDRLFVSLSAGKRPGAAFDDRVREIEARSDPLVRLALRDDFDIAGEFFRWEMATAVAGAVLRLNPFDQPNVAESKRKTQDLLSTSRDGDPVPPLRRDEAAAFLAGVRPGDYVAVQAFLEPCDANDEQLRRVCRALRDRLEAVVTVGYGPRYLHSTGQLHKGGPPTGHFIQILDPESGDLQIPGSPFGFGRLIAAQAEGDWHALRARSRPVLRCAGFEALLAAL